MTKKTASKHDKKHEHMTLRAAHIINPRGRIFEGIVTKKFPKRIVIEIERTLYVQKYERFQKKKMRLHARLPEQLQVEIGDLVCVQECRPLSKIIHHVVVQKIKSAEQKGVKL